MTAASPAHELSLTRVIAAPASKLYRAWTEPDLLKLWFCPSPWRVSHAELDLCPGGRNVVVMNGPNGEEMPSAGIYLEVVPGRKLVFTDAYTEGWVPTENPFMTGVVTFDDLGDGSTLYVARALHWTAENKRAHEEMGFHEGWGKATDQLEALVATL